MLHYCKIGALPRNLHDAKRQMSGPKTLAERLDWMAKNLPGFADELAEVARIERHAVVRTGLLVPKSHTQTTASFAVDGADSYSTHSINSK